MTNTLLKVLFCQFSFGFLRNWRGDHNAYDNPRSKLLSYRFVGSLINGIIYASPFGLTSLFHFMDRVEIYCTNKDLSKYDFCYKEFTSYNNRVII